MLFQTAWAKAMSDNSEQIQYWNGKAGETWVESQARIDTTLAPLSAAAIRKAAPQVGERVIDIGCGCGTTTLALADSGASVWGIDVSAPMLAHARTRIEDRTNIAFGQADASTQSLTPDHQLIFSRFGVMFFSDPVAAFTNLRTGLAADGRLIFLCWQSPVKNPWMSIAGAAVAPFLDSPATPPNPRAPGPFAFADAAYLNDILVLSGFNNIQIDSETANLKVGNDLDDAMRAQGQIGPLSRALNELAGEKRERALAAVRDTFSPLITADGLHLGAATWLVSATG